MSVEMFIAKQPAAPKVVYGIRNPLWAKLAELRLWREMLSERRRRLVSAGTPVPIGLWKAKWVHLRRRGLRALLAQVEDDIERVLEELCE